jgi:hypothetical protein
MPAKRLPDEGHRPSLTARTGAMKKKPPPESLLRFILQFVWGLISDLGDTLLVWLHFKHWPSIGPARWNRKPRPDPRAQAWQHLIVSKSRIPMPCSHRDSTGRSWVTPLPAEGLGRPHATRVCVQCGTTVPDEPPQGAS